MLPKALLAASLALLLLAGPALATTRPVADLRPGSTMALGLTGFALDFATNQWDMGLALGSEMSAPSHFKFDARGLYRFMHVDNLSAGFVGGLRYDPGDPGSRSYMVPDVGVALAYVLPGTMPISLRLGLTLTVDQPRYVDPLSPMPQGNFLQRLTFGPNTMVGLGLRLSDHLEVTVGGGTLLGARLSF